MINKSFTMVDYEIILRYKDCNCNHPNVPWNPCCGCGLPGCQSQELEDEYF